MTEPILRVTWTDRQTGRHGYAVIDSLVGGVAAGGTRLRAGVTLAEVERLARAMSLKNGALGIPSGGAKCGVDCDPADPEARDVLVRFVRDLKPLFATMIATGEDMGTSQTLLDGVFREAGLEASLHAALGHMKPGTAERVAAAVAVEVDGVPLVDLVGGFGVAEAALAAAPVLGLAGSGLRASIQGFGSMGGSTARYLARAGVSIVAVADLNGTVVNDGGLDVERLIRTRTALGEIDRAALGPGDRQEDRDAWLAADADIVVPAAVADAISEANCERVRARLIVEAANIPTTPGAEAALFQRDIVVVPDFIANGGTNAWFWWLLLGEIDPTAEAGLARIAASMREVVPAALESARESGRPAREAAAKLAFERLAGMAATVASV